MFTPIQTSLGAWLLFQGSSGLLVHNGAVFGISSLISGSVFSPSRDNVPIIAGLVSSILPVYLLAPSLLPSYPAAPDSLATAATTFGVGLLLGWGTKNGRGCTSGHMLCGISRLSARSIISTAIFFTTALITANVVGGGSNIPPCGPSTPCYTAMSPSTPELAFISGAVILSTITNFFIIPKTFTRTETCRIAFAYIAGLEFGLGLLISGMADSAKVLRFFALPTDPSRFDPSLALIMAFGLGPSLVTYLSLEPGQSLDKDKPAANPTLAERWRLPTATVADIDWRFVAGALAFGVAWGLKGVCPGPALLRSFLQPSWGLVTVSGYFVGNLF
ncbi:hypothetical protein N7509_002893 [Penicillium cosmopolitanum]|uniref:Sulphur transport domain-containing protein n=1 Tax=Penicillium cosmopolitanum TaxID=1131564 RepID=A0A9W9W9N0_9EURO|nr:uncharacterized protein N7509_002893 [Penicillium cosmopolitanum]KAJ5409010.1 hypothetical protein N7509_002893 [Penicillium cosmopolitanum]